MAIHTAVAWMLIALCAEERLLDDNECAVASQIAILCRHRSDLSRSCVMSSSVDVQQSDVLKCFCMIACPGVELTITRSRYLEAMSFPLLFSWLFRVRVACATGVLRG